jgi:hypothetical protein
MKTETERENHWEGDNNIFGGGGGKVWDQNIDPCLKEKIDLVRKEDEKDRQLDPEKESVDYRIFNIGLSSW